MWQRMARIDSDMRLPYTFRGFLSHRYMMAVNAIYNRTPHLSLDCVYLRSLCLQTGSVWERMANRVDVLTVTVRQEDHDSDWIRY